MSIAAWSATRSGFRRNHYPYLTTTSASTTLADEAQTPSRKMEASNKSMLSRQMTTGISNGGRDINLPQGDPVGSRLIAPLTPAPPYQVKSRSLL